MTNANFNRNAGVALVALGLGLVFLRITGVTMMSLLWPLWVLGPGAFALWMGFKEDQAQLGWVMPGAIVGGTGAILFVLNLTGQWHAWAYVWALYPVFVGGALYYTGRRNGDADMARGGEITARSGLYMLLGFGLFFELLIFGGLGIFGGPLLPLVLVGGGLALYAFRDEVNLGFLNDGEKAKRKLKNEEVEA
jgi:hypothetical protein